MCLRRQTLHSALFNISLCLYWILFLIGFLNKEIEKADIQVADTEENPETPQLREMIDLEVKFYNINMLGFVCIRSFLPFFLPPSLFQSVSQSIIYSCRLASFIHSFSQENKFIRSSILSFFIYFFFQAEFEQLENEMKDSNANYEALMKGFLELTEFKHILQKAQTFFEEVTSLYTYLHLTTFCSNHVFCWH